MSSQQGLVPRGPGMIAFSLLALAVVLAVWLSSGSDADMARLPGTRGLWGQISLVIIAAIFISGVVVTIRDRRR